MTTNIVSLRDVTKVYSASAGCVVALEPVSFLVQERSYMAISGPSGSGKSTLLQILGLLLEPTSGTVLIRDRDVGAVSAEDFIAFRRDHLGFVFQRFHLIPELSALRNVERGLFFHDIPISERRRRSIGALEAVGLSHRHSHQPSQLSGGEQQRVAIARAIVKEPSLLLADEPTGNLDAKTSEQIVSALEDLRTRLSMALVVVTHDYGLASRADSVVSLDR